jgi:hypothetical protein
MVFGAGDDVDEVWGVPRDSQLMTGSAPSVGLLDPAKAAVAAGLGLAATAGVTALASRLKMPWQTVEGEGFIAPWTKQTQTPVGWAQTDLVPPPVAQGAPQFPVGPFVIKSWTNASKDGRIPATVAFVKLSNGKVASQNLLTGEIKTWRPKKMVVISSNPRMSDIKKLTRVYLKTTKVMAKKSPHLKYTG